MIISRTPSCWISICPTCRAGAYWSGLKTISPRAISPSASSRPMNRRIAPWRRALSALSPSRSNGEVVDHLLDDVDNFSRREKKKFSLSRESETARANVSSTGPMASSILRLRRRQRRKKIAKTQGRLRHRQCRTSGYREKSGSGKPVRDRQPVAGNSIREGRLRRKRRGNV